MMRLCVVDQKGCGKVKMEKGNGGKRRLKVSHFDLVRFKVLRRLDGISLEGDLDGRVDRGTFRGEIISMLFTRLWVRRSANRLLEMMHDPPTSPVSFSGGDVREFDGLDASDGSLRENEDHGSQTEGERERGHSPRQEESLEESIGERADDGAVDRKQGRSPVQQVKHSTDGDGTQDGIVTPDASVDLSTRAAKDDGREDSCDTSNDAHGSCDRGTDDRRNPDQGTDVVLVAEVDLADSTKDGSEELEPVKGELVDDGNGKFRLEGVGDEVDAGVSV
mmetsp:Transcript_50110/g.83181  ORF Transcript_50110/g.83181 Transcript_50110/m.83181 type:complete len:277 (+) Transcript_50110:89-919(+)